MLLGIVDNVIQYIYCPLYQTFCHYIVSAKDLRHAVRLPRGLRVDGDAAGVLPGRGAGQSDRPHTHTHTHTWAACAPGLATTTRRCCPPSARARCFGREPDLPELVRAQLPRAGPRCLAPAAHRGIVALAPAVHHREPAPARWSGGRAGPAAARGTGGRPRAGGIRGTPNDDILRPSPTLRLRVEHDPLQG